MGRSPCCSKEGLNKGAWTAEEDEILTAYIRSQGAGKWRSIPKKAGLKRCGKSCRLRWLNYLRPDIKRGNISEQEEDLIIRLHRLLGNRWSLIAGRLPGRTDNEIKNYWNTILWKKVHGRPHRAPTLKLTAEDKKTKPTAEKPSAEASPQLPALPEESADAVDTPFNNRRAPSSAMAASSESPGEASAPLDNTANDLVASLTLFEEMCTMRPPESSLLLVAHGGTGEEEARHSASGMAAGDEGKGWPDDMADGALLGGWLEAGGWQAEHSLDFQYVASFLDLEEWL